MKKDVRHDVQEASLGLWNKFVKTVKKIPAKYKAFIGAGLFTLSSAAETPAVPHVDKEDTAKELHVDATASISADNTLTFADAAKSLNVKAGDKYKGVNMKFAEMEAPDLGHLFESGMDP